MVQTINNYLHKLSQFIVLAPEVYLCHELAKRQMPPMRHIQGVCHQYTPAKLCVDANVTSTLEK